MSCEACQESFEIDGEPLACEIETGCMIPPLSESGQHIMELRARLISLNGLVEPGTILKMYDADIDDIEMLAFLEEAIKDLRPEKDDG